MEWGCGMKCFALDPKGSEEARGALQSWLGMCAPLKCVNSDLVCKANFPPGKLQDDFVRGERSSRKLPSGFRPCILT